MADQSDNAQRPRPFVPPVRPFGGPAAPARPPLTPLTAPEGARPPAPFVARRPAKPGEETTPPTVATITPPAAPPAQPRDDAHLYGHDPFAEAALPAASAVSAEAELLRVEVPGDDAAPEEAATALAGLPYFDDTGSAHAAEESAAPQRTSGKVHRVGFDPALVLESIALRIRSGALQLPELDPQSSDEATLASVLAALLRDGRR